MPTETTYNYNETLFVSKDINGIDYGDLTLKLLKIPFASGKFEYTTGNTIADGTVTYGCVYDSVLSSDDETSLNQFVHDYVYVPLLDYCVIVTETQPTGTSAGTFTSGAWNVRNLNTIKGQQIFASLDASTNQITLNPGAYSFNVRAPSSGVGNNQVRVKNITSGIYGYGGNSHSPSGTISYAETIVYYTTRETAVFQIEHICQTTVTDVGLGKPVYFAPTEIYTSVFIHQLAAY